MFLVIFVLKSKKGKRSLLDFGRKSSIDSTSRSLSTAPVNSSEINQVQLTKSRLLIKIELFILVSNDQHSMVGSSAGHFSLALLIDILTRRFRSHYRLTRNGYEVAAEVFMIDQGNE